MDLESDRFQHLKYAEPEFQKESRAVLGEYNKNASSPFQMMEEKIMDTAFTTHTYKHTTMGFLKDIEDMPNQYEYSRQFFDRFYRPENCVLVVVGDVKEEAVFRLAEKYYGGWKHGGYVSQIPAEPAQSEPRSVDVKWQSPTMPYLMIGFKSPAYDPKQKDAPALDLIGQLGFGQTSPLYKKLVLEKQIVEFIQGDAGSHRDPNLFSIVTRLKSKDPKVMDAVRTEINATLEELRTQPVDAKRLADVKSAIKYGMAMSLDTTDEIAIAVAQAVELTGDPDSINQLFRTYDGLTSADLTEVAKKVLVTNGRTDLSLTEEVKK